jgi:glycosyltransferase involved in cell wall biosynthesis
LRNVIVVSDYAHVTGGAAKVAINSAIGLADLGLNVRFFAAVGPVADSLLRSRVRVECLHQFDILKEPHRIRAGLRGLWNAPAKRRLDTMLRDYSPEDTIVHFHEWAKALSSSLFEVVHKRGFPFTITFHDYFVSCPNGGFLVYPTEEICHRKPLSFDCVTCNCDPRHYSHKMWRVLRQLMQEEVAGIPKNLKHGIYISKFSYNVLRKTLPDSLDWHFVPNPVDVERAEPLDVTRNRSYVFVGRLSREKGAKIFAEATRRLGVEAVFVGDGEQRDEVERINPSARITGWVSPEEVGRQLERARALVFPSLWYETLGLSVVEAVGRGIPAIVSDGSAAADLVEHGYTGLHMRRGDAADLAEKLRMLDDDRLLERLSVNAYREFWRSPLSLAGHLEALTRVYETMLSGTERRGHGSLKARDGKEPDGERLERI